MNRRHFLSILPGVPIASYGILADRGEPSEVEKVNILNAVQRLIDRSNKQQIFRAYITEVLVSDYAPNTPPNWDATYGPWRITRIGQQNPDETGYPLLILEGFFTGLLRGSTDPGGNGWYQLPTPVESVVLDVGGQWAIIPFITRSVFMDDIGPF